ncbi:MAG TPA: hypothetical protein VFB41_04045 [Solirubrobacteraceae bacterium]|nr:hypothetical protein [Solirubrobacteraceae bacterium]
MRTKFFEYAGVIASVVLIVFGVGSIVAGVAGRHTVRNNMALEQIVGSPDMTPSAIAAEAKAAGLKNVSLPTCNVAGQRIDNGGAARCFASYMRIHTLEATGGQVYSQMGQYLDTAGKQTDDKALAAIDPKTKAPVANPARNIWVTETALTTALNTGYFAENVAMFSILMGLALLLTGIGFLVVTARWLRGPAVESAESRATAPSTPAVA